jgi:hypothetical protein
MKMFGPEQSGMLDQLRSKTSLKAQREALREVVQIQDPAFLDRLIAMDIGPEKALGLRLVPLALIAWVDGAPNRKEREAVLRAARERGLTATQVSKDVLASWLAKKPDPRLLELWKSEVQRVWNRFTADEQMQMRYNLLGAAREVAQAAGSFLGFTPRISARKEAVLKELESAVD